MYFRPDLCGPSGKCFCIMSKDDMAVIPNVFVLPNIYNKNSSFGNHCPIPVAASVRFLDLNKSSATSP